MEEVVMAKLGEVAARFAFANNLRGMTIWGYKTSEYVGEKVLVYFTCSRGVYRVPQFGKTYARKSLVPKK